MRLVICILFTLLATPAFADIGEAQAALSAGKYKKALELFTPLAEAGNARAAVTIGIMYSEGKPGIKQDYASAYSWYQKAFVQGDGDAWNNLGVMFRDGKGVAQNKKIAYLLFMMVRKQGLGSEETQSWAEKNVSEMLSVLSKEDFEQAICYSFYYLVEYVNTKGALTGIPDHLKASRDNAHIKDARFWSKAERERMQFTCPEGT